MLLIAIARADAARAGGLGAGWRISDVRGACPRCEKRAVVRKTRGGHGRRLGRDGEGQTQDGGCASATRVEKSTPGSADDLSSDVDSHLASFQARGREPRRLDVAIRVTRPLPSRSAKPTGQHGACVARYARTGGVPPSRSRTVRGRGQWSPSARRTSSFTCILRTIGSACASCLTPALLRYPCSRLIRAPPSPRWRSTQ
jgi:hypothetical protein